MFKKLKKKNDQDKENYFLLNEEEVQDPIHLLLTTLTFVSFQETEKKPHSHMRRLNFIVPKFCVRLTLEWFDNVQLRQYFSNSEQTPLLLSTLNSV